MEIKNDNEWINKNFPKLKLNNSHIFHNNLFHKNFSIEKFYFWVIDNSHTVNPHNFLFHILLFYVQGFE